MTIKVLFVRSFTHSFNQLMNEWMNESTNQSFISFQRTKTDSSKSASKSQSLSELPDADKKAVISGPVCSAATFFGLGQETQQ